MPQVFEKQGPHTRAELERLRALLTTARNDLEKMTMHAEQYMDNAPEIFEEEDFADRDRALLAIEHARHTMEQIDAALATPVHQDSPC